jgi:DNA-binding NarL/FixJ family response regulator
VSPRRAKHRSQAAISQRLPNPARTLARIELAQVLLARRGPGDIRAAKADLEQAVRDADAMGMAPAAAQARSLLLSGVVGPSGPLTPRESQIAALIAQGLSNRLIADHFHLSERTVETHVRSIFNKLGVDSRTRVATWHVSQQPGGDASGRQAVHDSPPAE